MFRERTAWFLGIATLAALAVALLSCEGESPADVPTAAVDPNFAGLVIKMIRGAYPANPEEEWCYGPCPYYSLTIRGDGSVEYEGFQNVDIIGKRRDKVSLEHVNQLVQRFEESGFFDLPSDFHCQILDVGATTTSVRLGDREQTIERCHADAPLGRLEDLEAIETFIDEITESERWVGDRPTFD